MICEKCGDKLPEGSDICSFCGYSNNSSPQKDVNVKATSNENKCYFCGAELSSDALFCHMCGKGTQALSATACPKCHNPLAKNSTRCAICGEALHEDDTPSTPNDTQSDDSTITATNGAKSKNEELSISKPCPHCGQMIDYQCTRCPECNKFLINTNTKKPIKANRPTPNAKCPNCGKMVHPQAKFCSTCKTDFSVTPQIVFMGNSPTNQATSSKSYPPHQTTQRTSPPTQQQNYNFYSKRCSQCNHPIEPYHAYCPNCRAYLGSSYNNNYQYSNSTTSPYAVITVLIAIFALFSFSMPFSKTWVGEFSGYDILEIFFKGSMDFTSQGACLLYGYISTIIALIASLSSFSDSSRLSISRIWSFLGILFILILTECEFDSYESGLWAYLISMILNIIFSAVGYSKRDEYY